MQFQRDVLLIFDLFFFILYSNQDSCCATPLFGETITKAKENQFPFILSLTFNSTRDVGEEEKNHICGGTLITSQHVLTAAHCFLHVENPHDILVKVGSRDLRKAESLEVDWWVFYKQWAENVSLVNTYHDVAIVKLRKSRMGSTLTPAKITTHQDAEFYGRKAITAGWGRIQNDEKPRFMNTGVLKVLPQDQCLFNLIQFDNNNLKYYVPGTLLFTKFNPLVLLTCGDSGDPLLFNGNEVIGINLGACSEDAYVDLSEHQNYHASINYYKKFILDVVRNRP